MIELTEDLLANHKPRKMEELSDGLAAAISELDEPTDRDVIMLYTLFAIDELLLSQSPRSVPDWIMKELANASGEVDEMKPSVRRQHERVARITDGVETCLGPRAGTNEAALGRLRAFDDLITARRAA